jgi:CubicO group peptidase (beta-lactamase class C family)
MTVRHLMTHTAGLTYGFMQAYAVDALYRQEHIDFQGGEGDLEESVDRLAALPLLCQPGSEWNYSVATDVLGRLVEVWSGRPLDAFFSEYIFDPLDMADAAFSVAPAKGDRFAACTHRSRALLSPASHAPLPHRPRCAPDSSSRRAHRRVGSSIARRCSPAAADSRLRCATIAASARCCSVAANSTASAC